MVESSKIDTVREYTDIVSLVEEYFPLKKTGANYKALCPFHQEKTPSFVVSPEKQIYHCFGCGKSGNVFNFLMEMEGVDFPESLRRLADRSGVKLESGKNKLYQKRKKLNQKIIKLNRRAAVFYNRYLKSEGAKKAYNYLIERGLEDKNIETFMLGYAPGGNQLIKKALDDGVDKEILLKSGLAGEGKNGNIYDKFRNRIVFPIMDERGQIKGFGGRVIDDSTGPKYLNTAQTKIFEKKKILYGLKQGKQHIRKKKKILLLEGYMDVIAAHQFDISYAVAALGTALTSQHIYKIKHWVDEVVFCFDSDEAGAKATVRAIDMVVESDLMGKVCQLPAGTDPEDIIRKDREEFEELLNNSVEAIDWRIKHSIYKFNDISDRAQKKIKIIRDLASLVNRISTQIKKEEVIKIISEKVGVSETAVKKEIDKSGRRKYIKESKKEKKLPLSRDEKICKELLHLALRYDDMCEDIKDFFSKMEFIQNKYANLLRQYLNDFNCDLTILINDTEETINSELAEMAVRDVNSDRPKVYFDQLKESLIRLKKAMEYNDLASELKKLHQNGQAVSQEKKKRFSRLARELHRNKTIKIGEKNI